MPPLSFSVLGPHPLLPDFLKQFHAPCNVQQIPWQEAQEELAKVALYRSGLDVSEIGTTWLDRLVGMDAIRPFPSEEIEKIGGSALFVPVLWQTTNPHKMLGNRIWAIPWLADVRVIFYWRDMLEQAGIDGKTAFQTPEMVEETMERLQASGIETPWGVWTDIAYTTLHNASTWVWQAGGGFSQQR